MSSLTSIQKEQYLVDFGKSFLKQTLECLEFNIFSFQCFQIYIRMNYNSFLKRQTYTKGLNEVWKEYIVFYRKRKIFIQFGRAVGSVGKWWPFRFDFYSMKYSHQSAVNISAFLEVPMRCFSILSSDWVEHSKVTWSIFCSSHC